MAHDLIRSDSLTARFVTRFIPAWARIQVMRRRWWFRIFGGLAVVALGVLALLWIWVSRDLPSVDKLRAYEPPLPTNVRDADGLPIHSYARERRVELSFDEYPKPVINAFLSAEDKTFFEHHGVDLTGTIEAVIDYISKLGSGQRARGGSTITQQVAKNLLIGNEYSPTRKMKEAILAWRIEDALTKQQILELYLNQIGLGRNAYGVEAAAHAYFGKDLKQLTLPEAAYLAVLPKGPANYDPDRYPKRAMGRRNWVLAEMEKNGFITADQRAQAAAAPLGTVPRQTPRDERSGGYFVEEVRRQLLAKLGETDRDGPNSVYSGGLWVRTSYEPVLQGYVRQALQDGLVRFEGQRGWTGPIDHKDIGGNGDRWQQLLLNTNYGLDYKDWRIAIVTAKTDADATIGFDNGQTGTLPHALDIPARGGGSAFSRLQPGDIVAVAPAPGGVFALRSIPHISGAFVIEEPTTGRVLAMQGGFDNRLQSFNRATQAWRQPGSTAKPIVYTAALEQGMTPASIIIDGPFCVWQGAGLGNKCFRNFDNRGGAGPHTMRWGIEQSRNLMTVRTASQIGMEHVVDVMQRMGVSKEKYPPYLSYALGAGTTTVSRMVNAYSMLVNQGRALTPTLIDFVQDRHGKVIWPENWQPCNGCNAPDWNGRAMPRPRLRTRQVVDPVNAYQMVHITEGVVQRGTAVVLRDLNRPMMGKTGTTSGPTDVWFVGGSPQMIGGLYLGYDTPANLGGYAQGGTIAAPIFKQFALQAYAGLEKLPFRAPRDVRMVTIDRATGKPVFGVWPGNDPKAPVIWEAFKPEDASRTRARSDSDENSGASAARRSDKPRGQAPTASDSDFLQRQGGIY